MHLFSPYDVERNMVFRSATLISPKNRQPVANESIRKEITCPGNGNWNCKLQQEPGYPYIINWYRQPWHPIDGRIVMSNPEILQVQTPSTVDNTQTYVQMGRDISCNLGSTNIVNLMQSPDFGHSVETMVRALTFITDHSDIDVVPSIQNGNKLGHTIGLGGMGLHSFFTKINDVRWPKPLNLPISTYAP